MRRFGTPRLLSESINIGTARAAAAVRDVRRAAARSTRRCGTAWKRACWRRCPTSGYNTDDAAAEAAEPVVVASGLGSQETMCVPICVMGCSISDDHRACPVPQGRIGEDPRRERLPDACHVGGVGGRPCSVKKCWRRGRELNPRPT